jgi:cardiolipin synthase A/B
VPDESLLYAITTAAQRGIDVELFVGEQGDQFMVHHAQNSCYEALLKTGVKIYLYPAPFVLHSKHFSVDDDVAVIGSSNMDIRSFILKYR